MENLVINATLRKDFGKQKAKAIRQKKEIPAVIYNKNSETLHVSIPVEDLKNALKIGSNELIRVNIKNNGESTQKIVLIKDVQKHIITNEPLHIDLYEVFENQKIKTKAPVLVIGKAKGIELGGILQIVTRELNIKCLPASIPKHIEIDVSNLNIGHTLHIKDIKPINGVEFIDNPDTPVVHVMVPAKEEVVQPTITEAAATEPEVIKKGKEAKEGEQPTEETKEAKQTAPVEKEKSEAKKESKKETK